MLIQAQDFIVFVHQFSIFETVVGAELPLFPLLETVRLGRVLRPRLTRLSKSTPLGRRVSSGLAITVPWNRDPPDVVDGGHSWSHASERVKGNAKGAKIIDEVGCPSGEYVRVIVGSVVV
jgi:hypothetical protein